jgi:hypothetical protein
LRRFFGFPSRLFAAISSPPKPTFTLRNALIRHCGGVTVLHQPPAPAFGVGARDPADVSGTLEQNEHIAFEVYAAPVQEADEYFRSLRRELQEALLEGVILIERQQVILI